MGLKEKKQRKDKKEMVNRFWVIMVYPIGIWVFI